MRKFPWYEDLDGICYCPNCENRVDDFWKGNCDDLDTFNPEFCPYCGQHLDWTETVLYGLIETHD